MGRCVKVCGLSKRSSRHMPSSAVPICSHLYPSSLTTISLVLIARLLAYMYCALCPTPLGMRTLVRTILKLLLLLANFSNPSRNCAIPDCFEKIVKPNNNYSLISDHVSSAMGMAHIPPASHSLDPSTGGEARPAAQVHWRKRIPNERYLSQGTFAADTQCFRQVVTGRWV